MSEHAQFGMELFWQEASTVARRVHETQADAIRQVGKFFADCIEKDGVIQAYGTGHSRAFAMELAGRAGGLVPVNRIDLLDLALRANWPLERVVSPEIERDLEAGQAILSCYRIEQQDVFIIASNSGVNVAIVEVALHAKQHGHTLIAVTSLEHSQRATSRHPSEIVRARGCCDRQLRAVRGRTARNAGRARQSVFDLIGEWRADRPDDYRRDGWQPYRTWHRTAHFPFGQHSWRH